MLPFSYVTSSQITKEDSLLALPFPQNWETQHNLDSWSLLLTAGGGIQLKERAKAKKKLHPSSVWQEGWAIKGSERSDRESEMQQDSSQAEKGQGIKRQLLSSLQWNLWAHKRLVSDLSSIELWQLTWNLTCKNSRLFHLGALWSLFWWSLCCSCYISKNHTLYVKESHIKWLGSHDLATPGISPLRVWLSCAWKLELWTEEQALSLWSSMRNFGDENHGERTHNVLSLTTRLARYLAKACNSYCR